MQTVKLKCLFVHLTSVMHCCFTVPTPPRELKVMERSTDTLNISWARPLNMSFLPHTFLLQYSSTNQSLSFNCSQNFTSLTGLSAGVLYNITVKTVGALGYMSTSQYLKEYTSKLHITISQG